jgi:hypothetical protein
LQLFRSKMEFLKLHSLPLLDWGSLASI